MPPGYPTWPAEGSRYRHWCRGLRLRTAVNPKPHQGFKPSSAPGIGSGLLGASRPALRRKCFCPLKGVEHRAQPDERDALLLQSYGAAEPIEAQVGVEFRFLGGQAVEGRDVGRFLSCP